MNQNSDFIPFALPSVGEEEKKAVMEVLDSGWLTTGKKSAELEKRFCEITGAEYALSVNSATSGLHLVLESFGITRGSKVLTTPYTFAATAEVIRYMGAHPVFADTNSNDYNINPDEIEKAFSSDPEIKAVIPVHVGGLLCDMERIKSISERYNAAVIEDAAHAFPVFKDGKCAGNMSDAGVYSFYATKTITTGEGGMVVTNSESAAKRMRIMRLHGIDRDVWDRYNSNKSKWYYEVVEPGFKYNMTDISAAMGIEQLKKSCDFLEKRKKIAEKYNNAFADLDFIKVPPYSGDHAWHLYTVKINEDKLSINRDQFIEKLFDKGIGVSVHFIPLHIMPYYKNKYSLLPGDFPNALENFSSSISLPIYPDLTEEQTEKIIESVTETGNKYSR